MFPPLLLQMNGGEMVRPERKSNAEPSNWQEAKWTCLTVAYLTNRGYPADGDNLFMGGISQGQDSR